jgi:glycine cleavage system H lipoate-binding protein
MLTESRTKFRIKGFQVVENECIWMKAGVINFKRCDSAYNCQHCAFDKAMRHAMGKVPKESGRKTGVDWGSQMRRQFSGSELPCRHYLTGRVEAPKICTLNYECHHCAYDQMLDDIDLYHLPHRPQMVSASGYQLAQDYYYHPGHSWVRIEHGGLGRIGLDDFAASLFGACRSLTLPPLGAPVAQDQIGWSFQRDGHFAAVLAPVSGTVLAVNPLAREHPEIVHQDPYHGGWLFMVEPELARKSLKKLYFGDRSRQWMEFEAQQLLGMMGEKYAGLSAIGGRPVRDVVGSIPSLRWNDLVKRFLHTEGK